MDDNIHIVLTPEQLRQLSASSSKNLMELTQTVSQKVLKRVAYALIDKDLDEMERLDREDDESSSKVREFLLTKVPNLDKIINEEITKLNLNPGR